MTNTAYIFDIDGTIADNSHRQQFVRSKPKNWKAYNSMMADDKPIDATIAVCNTLYTGADIILCTGRQEKDRKLTEDWLLAHKVEYDELFMRKTEDFRDDTIVKKEMLDKIRELGYAIVGAFDDRPKVVAMWRTNGIFVFDINQSGEVF
jgi:FMN phosphatase YigB (HAD superfamily)